MRESLFGRRLQNVAECPECHQRIEWETDIQDIRLPFPHPGNLHSEYVLKKDGYTIHFRLPDSNDLLDVIAGNQNGVRPEQLLGKIVTECKFKGNLCEISELPETILTALDHRLEVEDQQADIIMSVQCMSCNHQWDIQFDIMSYLWTEICSWVRHLLQDVGALARTYGWSEMDILSMSAARRHIYLEMMTE